MSKYINKSLLVYFFNVIDVVIYCYHHQVIKLKGDPSVGMSASFPYTLPSENLLTAASTKDGMPLKVDD